MKAMCNSGMDLKLVEENISEKDCDVVTGGTWSRSCNSTVLSMAIHKL